MNFLVLSGGVGGAKFADGMAKSVGAENLTVIVNTADDHNMYGLHISPDLDSVMYALAGINNNETGWGLADETWSNFEMLQRYGSDPWFRLGDKDLATHFLRTNMLKAGLSLTEITRTLAQKLGIQARILIFIAVPTPPQPDGSVDLTCSGRASPLPLSRRASPSAGAESPPATSSPRSSIAALRDSFTRPFSSTPRHFTQISSPILMTS